MLLFLYLILTILIAWGIVLYTIKTRLSNLHIENDRMLLFLSMILSTFYFIFDIMLVGICFITLFFLSKLLIFDHINIDVSFIISQYYNFLGNAQFFKILLFCGIVNIIISSFVSAWIYDDKHTDVFVHNTEIIQLTTNINFLIFLIVIISLYKGNSGIIVK